MAADEVNVKSLIRGRARPCNNGGTTKNSSLDEGLFYLKKRLRMAKFNDLSEKSVDLREEEISKYWMDMDLLHKAVEARPDDKRYVYYEGPPTANGRPGIHHVISRTLKDATCRYKTMRGYRVERKAGWDTHGLPVEIGVEKALGLSSKKEIEDYGVGPFNEKCRESVFTYEKLWREMSERMAFMVDMDNPYITLDNNYIETVWWILDQLYEKGLVYEGAKILPYCPRCGTGLASHEVAQGYAMIKTETVYAKFKAEDEDAYFLAWTTTPWTLPSNVTLAVNPEVTYIKAEVEGDYIYLAKDLAGVALNKDYEILEELKGSDLVGRKYEQLIDDIQVDKEAFYIVGADFVTTSDGTGIVHTAPAFGEDDYEVCRKHGLPMINPVDDEGRFTDTQWKGMGVMDADPEIIAHLRDTGKLYRTQKVEHNYPHCWRCDTALIYYSKPSWYIEVTKCKDQLIAENNKVNWYPDFVGEKRFGNWLENLKDWAITRSRYWGTPFPIWKCDDCKETTSVGSRKELVERAIEDIDESIELHRPYVDDVHLRCSCGGQMTREPEVIDVWFDSGAMPFAQHHYPFENKEAFEKSFPADFINEGIDQTRGWFYSLLAISVMLTGKAPYKNVLVNDLILDKHGKKMSKSRGNTLDPMELFDKYGADVVRYYSISVSPPWLPTRFDEDGLKEVNSKFFRTLRSTYNFFQLYANTDGIDPRSYEIEKEDLTEIDRWVLSKYNSLIQRYLNNMDVFEYTNAIRDIGNFLIEDVSNWYIRRNRRRFWKEGIDTDKKLVYKVTYDILYGVVQMMAPFTPYISEEIYHNLTQGQEEKSVHLTLLLEPDLSMIDAQVENKMDLVRTVVTLGRASREQVQIKVRQPLNSIIVDGANEEIFGDLVPLIKEELNIKEVIFAADVSEFMNYQIKPNYAIAGKEFGKAVGEFAGYLAKADPVEVIDQAESAVLKVVLGGEERTITGEYLDIRVDAKEGYDVSLSGKNFVILDTSLTDELLAEGYARELISKVQQMRKSLDFEVTDNIRVQYQGDDVLAGAIDKYGEMISSEVLAKSLERSEDLASEWIELNDKEIKIEIERLA